MRISLNSDIFRTTAFRNSALASAAIACSTLLLFAFIYWQTAGWEATRIDDYLLHETLAMTRESPTALDGDVNNRFARDLHRQSFAAVFGSDLSPQAGNITTFPPGLPKDGVVRNVVATRQGPRGTLVEDVRAIARQLPDGRILVMGRSETDIAKLRRVVLRALELGLLPALLLALGAGTFASRRTLNRVRSVNRSVARIMQGHLHERLESHDTGDALDQLGASVNRMLDEIERLMAEVQDVGNDIAHDLRTPLTRVRARLERGLGTETAHGDLPSVVGHAIADLDQALGMMTALLRIGQIEAGARHAGFAMVTLSELAREAVEFYRPLAEMRAISLSFDEAGEAEVLGDRDLLFEVATNLLDNAVKFTPDGGAVRVQTGIRDCGAFLTVRDSGPGIADADRKLVVRRFHRGDPSRHVPGSGLGLNLVAAILRLHGFHLHMADLAPGLAIEMRCWADPLG
jgi:signal transduction histidine kinase